MNIIQNICTKNPCYTAGKKITVKGLMLHSVGCSQPSAAVFIKTWNQTNPPADVCPHAIVDGNTGDVYQTLPWNHRGWHGGGTSNNTHIGVEMCEPGCIKYTSGAKFTCSDKATAKTVVQRTYDNAVQLFARLCKQYNLDPLADGVIVSHKEGHTRGIASNHGDPEHLWKGLGMGYTMDTFRKAVKAAMGGTSTTSSDVLYRVQVGAYSNKTNAETMLAKLKAAGFDGIITTDKKTTASTIQIGSTVKLKQGAKTYTGGTLSKFVYGREYTVRQIDGDRVVIELNNVIVAAVRKCDLSVV